MADYSASMAARGQPTVVSAVSTSGASRTVLDEARAGEEEARRELMEAAREADALAAIPVVRGAVLTGSAVASPVPSSSTPTAGEVPVVVAEAVGVVVDENRRRPKGGIAALMNTLRIS